MRVKGNKMEKMRFIIKDLKNGLIIGGICLLMLCGCSSKTEKQCRENVEAFLQSYQSLDETCSEYLSKNENEEKTKFEGFQAFLAKQITYKINSVDVNEKNRTVEVKITNIDFKKIIEEFINKKTLNIASAEEFKNELIKKIQSKDAPKRKFNIVIKLDDDCKIIMTSELSNALLGGYTQYINELIGGELDEK